MLDRLMRWRFAVLALIAVTMYVVSARNQAGDNDWTFFAWGSDTLFGAHRPFVRTGDFVPATGPGGLHLYGSYPFLQIGPPAMLLGKLLQVGPEDGLPVAAAVVQLLGFLAVVALDRASGRDVRSRATVLLGGGATLVVWVGLTHTTHLDDAIALSALACAAWAIRGDHPVVAGALLGLSAASKPWAVVCLALVLALPSWRARATSTVASAGVILAFWGPFVVADRRTLDLGQVHVLFSPTSAPAALGARAITDPQALRLLQFLGGLLLACGLVAAGRWALAPLAGFAVRLALEPFPYQYYAASLVLAALLADLIGFRPRLPLATLAVAVAWALITVTADEWTARTRLLLNVLLIAASVGAAVVRRPGRRDGVPGRTVVA